jgi:hypothetical protein
LYCGTSNNVKLQYIFYEFYCYGKKEKKYTKCPGYTPGLTELFPQAVIGVEVVQEKLCWSGGGTGPEPETAD